MNKIFIFLICYFNINNNALSQKGQPPLGKIDKADLTSTLCHYDKEAVAYKLIDWGNVHYQNSYGESPFKTTYKRRQRIKIINDKGLKYANVTIPFYSKDDIEKIIKVEGYVYNLEDNKVNITAIKKNATYTKSINKYFSELIIPFSNVKNGSVIEYQYTLESENLGQLKEWSFQDEIPTRYSEYEVQIPLVFTYNIQPSVIDTLITTEKITEDLINTKSGVVRTNTLHKSFIMHNLKALPNEPFMASAKDYQQRLQFQLAQINYSAGQVKYLTNSWEDVVSMLQSDEDFGVQLQNSFTLPYSFVSEIKSKKDDDEKLAFVLKYFQKNFLWNNQESIYSTSGVKTTWATKTGTTGDINLLFVRILKDAGLNSYPILFSTKNNGTVNTFLPFVNQFNTTLSYISTGNKSFIVDAADKFSNHLLTPEKVLHCNGFVVDDSIGKWVLGKELHNKYKTVVAIKGNINEDGVMSGEANVISDGYAGYNKIKNWYSNKNEFMETYFANNGEVLELTDLQTKSNESSGLFEQKANFTYKLGTSGEYQYFITNIYTELNKNVFTTEERTTDIDFGYTQEYQLFGNFTIPHKYVFEELPKNISFSMPDKSIVLNRFVDTDDNNLNIRFTIEFKKPYYSVAIYPEFKEFYKKMFDLLNEQIVIKKK